MRAGLARPRRTRDGVVLVGQPPAPAEMDLARQIPRAGHGADEAEVEDNRRPFSLKSEFFISCVCCKRYGLVRVPAVVEMARESASAVGLSFSPLLASSFCCQLERRECLRLRTLSSPGTLRRRTSHLSQEVIAGSIRHLDRTPDGSAATHISRPLRRARHERRSHSLTSRPATSREPHRHLAPPPRHAARSRLLLVRDPRQR